MVAFRFNTKDFLFQSGIDEIEGAYSASITSYENRLRGYAREEIKLSEDISAGIVDSNTDTGPGDAEMIEYHREKALDAMLLIREAFLE